MARTPRRRTPRHFELHIYIATLFLALVVAFAALLLTMQYVKTRDIMLSAASEEFRHIDREIRGAIRARFDAAILLADFYAKSGLANDPTMSARTLRLTVMSQFLRSVPTISAIYVGRDNGDFFLGRPLAPGSAVAKAVNAPATAKYLFWRIERSKPGEASSEFLFLDDALKLVEDRPIPGETFDPRTRPWYAEATKTDATVITSPYRFFTTGEIGTTFAKRGSDGAAVAAVDVTLASLSELLQALRPTKSAELVIFDSQHRIVADANSPIATADPAASGLDLVAITAANRPVLEAIVGSKLGSSAEMQPVRTNKGEWDGVVSRLDEPGPPLYLAVTAPRAELLANATQIRNQGLLVAIAVVLVSIPLTLACSRLASQPLGGLTREAAAIRSLRFDQPVQVRSFITEIALLAQTMDSMKSTIRRFIEIGAALAGERKFDRLLQRLLVETMALAGARGGAVYLSQPDGTLTCPLARWADATCDAAPPDLRLDRDIGHPVVSAATRGGLIDTIRSDEITRWFPGFGKADPLSALAVPLRNRQGAVIGALMLALDKAALQEAEEEDVLALVQALAGTAATAIESQRLLLEQKRLMEAFIELVAGAIDRKSAYTGGHCARVPELTEMLARAAEAATEGPFKDFTLSPEQWEELHIAAWLHDCGKVTTPEFVVDKATKLETIYDRIHEVRMRFEVLKREAEAECWRDIAAGAEREARLRELRTSWDVLDEEFAFVAQCNEGGEFMAPDKVERLRQIAGRTWTRTLDDRIGLSHEEQQRKAATPAMPLPVRELLLADKPEHVVARRDEDRIALDNPWGFKIAVPEHLYNRGELHNLTVGRGTLTAEDRYKINEHIIETIRMLSRLPWPPHLDRVVEIACGHHEKMDGTGYPRRLTRDEMSVPARMMAVADIFEALTAADRPYKKAKPLSESLAIMARMRDEAHIDAEIFELFVSAGVYQSYAERFLAPEQNDVADVARYLQPV